MSKAIFVLNEMPENCIKCPLRYDNYGISEICALKDDLVDYFYETNTKPNWCPLKEMPEKREFGVDPYQDSHTSGWNACIDKIGG